MFSQTLRMWRIDTIAEVTTATESPHAARPPSPTSAPSEPRSRFDGLRILPRPDDDF
jgi:hypothetical protein